MNGYQRIRYMLEGKTPDRVPVMLHNFMLASKEIGVSMGDFRQNPNLIAKAFISSAEKYKLDGILTDLDTVVLAGAFGATLDYPDDEPARMLRSPSKKDYHEFLANININNLMKNERVLIYLEALRIISKQCKGEMFLRGNADQGPFGLAFLLYGLEEFLIDLMDEDCQENIFALLDRCLEVCTEFHKMVYKTGADCTSFGDSVSGPDVVSPSIYRKYAKPYQDRLALALSKEGIQTICHICGNTDAILDDIKDSLCCGFELDYKTDIEKVKIAFKDKKLFLGNIDPSGVIAMGTSDVVSKTTKNILDIYKDNGRFILAAGCAIPPMTPEENIFAIVKTVEEYGYYV
jgi:uroporphyrinogen decarboxylase